MKKASGDWGGSSWGILLILLFVNVLHNVDRTVPLIIAEEIKKEFLLSDSQLGLFTGLAYGVSYAVAALFTGPLVDRLNRSRLLAGMLTAWSAFTALGALAASYWQLLFMRLSVGAAEAGGSPATLSILSDIFPPEKRGTAIGFYKMGGPIGYFCASAGCGFIASHYGWRAALVVAGVPGLLLAFAVWRWVPNPERGAIDGPQFANDASLTETVRMTLRQPAIVYIILGLLFFSFANAGMQGFLIPFLVRVHDLSLISASSYMAMATMIGSVGPLLFGLLNDRSVRAAGIQGSAFFSAILAAMALVAGSTMVLAEIWPVMISSLVIWQALTLGMTTVNCAALLTLTPPSVRGTIMATMLVAGIFVGAGIGPVVLGTLSDMLGGGTAVRYAGLIVLCSNAVAVFFYYLAGRHLARSRPAFAGA